MGSWGKGKRGGARGIYYWATSQGKRLMLMIYGKGEQSDLPPAQKKVLRKIVKQEYPCRKTCLTNWS